MKRLILRLLAWFAALLPREKAPSLTELPNSLRRFKNQNLHLVPDNSQAAFLNLSRKFRRRAIRQIRQAQNRRERAAK